MKRIGYGEVSRRTADDPLAMNELEVHVGSSMQE